MPDASTAAKRYAMVGLGPYLSTPPDNAVAQFDRLELLRTYSPVSSIALAARNRRFSWLPTIVMAYPDNSVDPPDRWQLIDLYIGVSVDDPTATSGSSLVFARRSGATALFIIRGGG